MLMRSFTKREKIILLVLVIFLVVGFYFLMIHYPVTTRLEEIEAEKLNVQDQTDLAIAKGQVYVRMKNELADLEKLPIGKLTVMPAYDNFQSLTFYFSSIFEGVAPDLRFSDPKIEGRIATRSISFSFTAPDYATAKETLKQFTGTGYRCLLQNVSISPEEGNLETDPLKVSGTIIFYELIVGN